MSVTNKDELLEYGMNEKADVMHLEGDDINDLEDVNVRSLHLPQKSSFYNLRVLSVSKCAELKYLFTVGVATNLSKLEHLRVSSCPNMEELIHIEKRNSGTERITFPKLKFLSFCDLPKLLRFCNDVNVIELPQLMELHLDHLPNFTSIYPNNKLGASVQPFLNKEILIPKLEKLQICRMENLKEIWPCEITAGEDVNICISMLRSIKIERCGSLVNIFPRNPMRFLHYLQELEVKICKSIEMLFNIDLRCAYEIEEVSSSLIRISVERLPKLREVWRVESVNNSNLPILGFQCVESVHIQTCKSFRNLFTPSTANFDLPALMDLEIDGLEHWEDSCLGYDLFNDVFEDNQEQEINVILKQEESLKVDDNMPIVAFSSYMIPTFNHVSKLSLRCYRGVEVVFDIDNACSREVFPCLKDLKLEDMG